MAKTHATLQTEIGRFLQDSANTYVSTTEINDAIDQACAWASIKAPRVALYHYTVESRTGTATATTASALVDTTESQFVAGDVGKVVHNTTDHTWAVITAFVSSSQLTLSADIMVSGENYEIYNKKCTSKKQINLEDIEDYVDNGRRGVVRLEYPIGKLKRFSIDGDVLTIDADVIEDSKVASPAANTEVLIWIKRRHYVSQLTDLAGAVDLVAGYAAGDTAIHVDSLAATEVIAEDTDFTIANRRYTYTVTATATLAGNEADITIFPGLENAVANDVVVTFIGSTLTRALEPMVVTWASGYAAISWAANQLTQAELALVRVGNINEAVTAMIAPLVQAGIDISSGRTEANKVSALVTRVTTQIDEAIASMTAGYDTINKVNLGGFGVPVQYLNQAQGELQTANEFLSQARADESIAGTYGGLGARELTLAASELQRAGGYLSELGARLNIGRAMETVKNWGLQQQQIAEIQLDTHLRARVATTSSSPE